MTDAAFLLSVLEDGKPHSTDEILKRSQDERGVGLMVHSRAADLRKKGHFITCDLAGRHASGRPIYQYTLLGSLPEPSLTADPSSSSDQPHEPQGGREGSESEQSSLFESPSKPAWA